MILEAMKRIRALEQRVDALEAENARAHLVTDCVLKAAREWSAMAASSSKAGAPERKRAKPK